MLGRWIARMLTLAVVIAALAIAIGAGSGANASFPGGNGRIAFTQYVSATSHIWTMDASGHDREQETSGDAGDYTPAWSPDGATIAFRRTGSPDGHDGIYLVDANGQNLRMIPGTEDGYQPSWSPDGARIAFDLSSNGDDIAVVDTDGQHRHDLTATMDGDQFSPAWSPDGAQIAFVDETTSGTDLMRTDTSGIVTVNITNTPSVEKDYPDWAPDGSLITFEGYTANTDTYDIYTIKPNGDTVRNLTMSPSTVQNFDPAFSPDGQSIVFGRTDLSTITTSGVGSSYLYIMDVHGGNLTPTDRGAGFDDSPSWGVATAASGLTWGDNDCSGQITPADALETALNMAGVDPANQSCPAVGQTLPTASFGERIWGDLDCSGAFDAPDILLVLEDAAGLPPANLQDCPALGITVTLQPPG